MRVHATQTDHSVFRILHCCLDCLRYRCSHRTGQRRAIGSNSQGPPSRWGNPSVRRSSLVGSVRSSVRAFSNHGNSRTPVAALSGVEERRLAGARHPGNLPFLRLERSAMPVSRAEPPAPPAVILTTEGRKDLRLLVCLCLSRNVRYAGVTGAIAPCADSISESGASSPALAVSFVTREANWRTFYFVRHNGGPTLSAEPPLCTRERQSGESAEGNAMDFDVALPRHSGYLAYFLIASVRSSDSPCAKA